MSQTATNLDLLVDSVGELFTLPRVAAQVLELTSKPKVDVRRLKECIETDPALTARILRVVNSSLFGLCREVSDLSQALALLGTKPLKLLVLGFSLPDELFVGLAGDLLESYWRKTLTKAIAARELTQAAGRDNGDEAFIAGLLQDVGVLVLARSLGVPYVAVWRKVSRERLDLAAAEREALGYCHLQLAARLLEKWNLPGPLVQAVYVPAERSLAVPRDTAWLCATLRCSELAARLLVDGEVGVLPQLSALAAQELSLSESKLPPLLEELPPRVQQLADVLSLSLADQRDYHALLAEAHAQLAGVAAEVAREIARAQAKAATEALLRSDEARALKEAARSLSGLVSRGIARIGPEAAPRIPATPPGRTAAAMVDAPAEPNKAASPNQAKDAAQSAADRHLTAAVQAAVTVCRHQRGPLSLMLVELDGYGDLAFGVGTSEAGDVLQELEAACAALEHDVVQCVQVRETRFAVLLPLCDRREAVRLGNELLAAQRARLSGNAAAAARLIAGVATVSLPPRNFPPQDLITAATRCLTAAQLYGGDCLKSIEIY